MKKFIYVAQALLEKTRCKVGITNDLDRRLKEYNSTTGHSKDNAFRYLFAAEVQNAEEVEKEFKKNFEVQREEKSREIYFYNTPLFSGYLEWIRGHAGFVKEVVRKEKKERKPQTSKTAKSSRNHALSMEERGVTRHQLISKSKSAQNDEWYTLYEDIEKEVFMYPVSVWKDKVIFCNCDDAVDRKNDNNTSNFALFFIRNFQKLGLKKLICTHFAGKVDLFNAGSRAYVFTKDGFKELTDFPKDYDGSFDHPYSLKILNEEADIVCTNPPFSRLKEFYKIVIESGKKFLIIGHTLNANKTYLIPWLKNKKIWAGHHRVDWFLTPDRQIKHQCGMWFTNIPLASRPKLKNIKFCGLKEIPEKYKKIDNNGMLLVDNNWIPNDYKKPFAVSVAPILSGILESGFSVVGNKDYTPKIGESIKFGRVIIQKDP